MIENIPGTEQKRIHFIGICGVAMSALAIAFDKKGWAVSGSDAGFYPPVSTHLKKQDIYFYPGWHPEKMIAHGVPDVVVVGNVASSNNKEWQYIQKHNIPYKSYPEIIADYFVQKNSIVCAGTYGKTTNTTLLTWIFTHAHREPNYMFGGISINMPQSAMMSDSDWSILEGDEYKTARWDNGAKFKLYAPTHLLLSSVSWDHADVYPTEESYFAAFSELIDMVPTDGTIIACLDDAGVRNLITQKNLSPITYGMHMDAQYRYDNVQESVQGISCTIHHDGQSYTLKAPVLGTHMAENITGCFAMAHQAGISVEKIIESIAHFDGIKRRLEKRAESNIVIFDDIAHSPAKAHSVLATLRKLYDKKIIIVFEPNTGNRKTSILSMYDNAFADADAVIIPKLTKLKTDPDDPDQPIEGAELRDVIARTHAHVHYIEEDKALVSYLQKNTNTGDVIVFCGSHGFRGMIEDTIAAISE